MSSKRKPGRPTKLTPEVQQTICDALERGEVHVHAAEHGGISEATYYNWIRKGEEGDKEYVEFLLATMRAEAEGRKEIFKKIRCATETDWRAAAFLLERRYPQHYGKAARVDLTVGGKVEIDHGLAQSALEKLAGLVSEAEITQGKEGEDD